jgi:serine/threonine protein kinase
MENCIRDLSPTFSLESLESDDYIPHRGEVLNGRYHILDNLGIGAYSAVWKCFDQITQKEVAVKIHKCDSQCAEAGKFEASILGKLSHPNILAILDKFTYYDNQPTAVKYFCCVYELCEHDLEYYLRDYYCSTDKYRTLDGNECDPTIISNNGTICKSSKKYNDKLDNAIIRNIMRQLLAGLVYLHDRSLMHLDIKPENILCCQSNIKLADYGAAEHVQMASCGIVGTRYYRAPEILLGLPHCLASDIWSVGCLLFELCTGDILFRPHNYRNYGISRDEDHLAMIIELCGHFPEWMLGGFRRKRFLHKNGQPRHINKLYIWPLNRVLQERYRINDPYLIDLLQGMLHIDPTKRFTAAQSLTHRWLNM